MARKQNPLTRLYQVTPGKSGWARIWITDDGCISILSDWGNYGYWFGAPGCEFREFLTGCDDDYLGNKFGGGRSEFDGEATRKNIKRAIIKKRRRRWTASEARAEWQHLQDSDLDNSVGLNDWMHGTKLDPDDYFETPVYVIPQRVRALLKHVWPLLVEQLRAELASESAPSCASPEPAQL